MEKNRESFEKKKMVIHFGSVFTNKKMNEAFTKFLKIEQNPEPFKFLQAVQNLKDIELDSEKISKFKQIIETYVLTDSKYEINVSDITKKDVLEKFKKQENEEKWILEETPTAVFFKMYYSVYEELRQDSFHRFVRTNLCDNVIKNLQSDSTVVSPYITKQFDYKDSDFTTGFVEDIDIEFAKLICEDSFTWELVTNKHAVNGYHSKSNYLPDLSFKTHTTAKYECTFSIPFHKTILCFMSDESILQDPNATYINYHGYLSTDDIIEHCKKNGDEIPMSKCKRTALHTSCDAIFGFPFNMRLIKQVVSLHYEPETKSLYAIFKPHLDDFSKFCKFEKIDLVVKKGSTEKKNVKGMYMFDFTVRKFQKLDENKTFYQEITLTDLGGWAKGNTFGNLILKERAHGIRKSTMKTSKNFSDDAKISDFKEKFSSLDENGRPKDMYGKLLIDLDIEGMDKEYEESQKKKE